MLHPNTPATALNLFFSHSYRYLNHASQTLPPHRPHDWASHPHPCAEDLATSSLDGNECCRCLIPPLSSGMWVPLVSLLCQDFSTPRSSTAREGPRFPAMPPESHTQLFSPAPTTARAIATKTTMVCLSHGGTSPAVLCATPSPRLYPRHRCPLTQAVPQVSLSPSVGSECAKSRGKGVIVALLEPQ